MVVNELVAIVAQPSQIFNRIIEMVMVYVVHRQNPRVVSLTQSTDLCRSTLEKNCSICVITIFIIRVILIREMHISPLCLTTLTAKEQTTLRSLESLAWFIGFFLAHMAGNCFACTLGRSSTERGAVFSIPILNPRRLHHKLSLADFTRFFNHMCKYTGFCLT